MALDFNSFVCLFDVHGDCCASHFTVVVIVVVVVVVVIAAAAAAVAAAADDDDGDLRILFPANDFFLFLCVTYYPFYGLVIFNSTSHLLVIFCFI